MQLEVGLCFSYSGPPVAGVPRKVRYARLAREFGGGLWRCTTLLPADSVSLDQIPIDPDDAALALVDSAIRLIPILILDERDQHHKVLPMLATTGSRWYSPIFVCHDRWYRSLHALYRPGMEGVFRIAHMANLLGEDEFPFSARRNEVLAAGPAGLAAVLLATPRPIELVASAVKFRHALADAFASTLKRNGPKNASISFEMRVSAQDFSVLCSYGPVLAAADSIRLKPNGGFHKISFVVYPDSLYTHTQAKELI
ncbi:hypothetical protein B484DRAFT_407056, partial [Ochromonadaceae sp. CCMP2298]